MLVPHDFKSQSPSTATCEVVSLSMKRNMGQEKATVKCGEHVNCELIEDRYHLNGFWGFSCSFCQIGRLSAPSFAVKNFLSAVAAVSLFKDGSNSFTSSYVVVESIPYLNKKPWVGVSRKASTKRSNLLLLCGF